MPDPFATLKKRALSLGAANAFDYGLHFLLPVVLVRFLTPEAFGRYRLVWLAIMTLIVTVPLQMPQSLNFFLPRADAAERRLHVHQTLLYMAGAGLLGSLLIGPWNPLLPPTLHALAEYGALVPALAALYVAASLADYLPTIDQRVGLQATFTVALALARTLPLAAAAWLTGDLTVVLWLLFALFMLKLLLLYAYVGKMHGIKGPWFERHAFGRQFTHAAPFGVATALHGLRGQADQWVVAHLFALGSFAAFSIGAVLGPMVTLVRHSVSNVFLPSMSKLHAGGDMAGMAGINSRANLMVAALVYPLLAFAFAFAEELITLVYTQDYVAAAPVMRVYAVALVAFVVELSSVMLLLRQGGFALRLNLAVLAVSVTLSWFAAHQIGLAGAAAGSALALYVDRYATLRRIRAVTGLPLAQLQDWPTLGRLLLFSALAGALARGLVDGFFAAGTLLPRLAVAAATVAAAYGALWALSEASRGRPLLAFRAGLRGIQIAKMNVKE